MSDVQEVLRRWQAGESLRQMSKAGAGDRKTVTRYVKTAIELGLERDSSLDEETIRRVLHAVQRQVEGRPTSQAWARLQSMKEKLRNQLFEEKLQLTRVHELIARQGVEVSYTMLRRFAHRELGWRERKRTVRVDDAPPGEEAQMDFGEMGKIKTPLGPRKLWALIVVLCYSRHSFVYPTLDQTLPSICEGLDAAWRFFGGVPKRVVPDNPKPIVLHAKNANPRLNERFLEYAQSRGFFVDPARIRQPQDKPRVERAVPYVRERWFKGEQFDNDIGRIRAHAEDWCRDVAGTRIHGTTRRVPLEVFESEEKDKLLPAPSAPFDLPEWLDLKVHPDHHIQARKALYSVPTRYLGQRVRVRLDRTSVRIYFRNELVKTHARVASGERSTDPGDYPKGTATYATRRIDDLLQRASAESEVVGAFAANLLSGPLPWTRMRQAYQLLRLCERYGVARVDAVCQRALEFEAIDVPRIERMLRTAQTLENSSGVEGRVIPLPEGRFQRPKDSFRTEVASEGEP